MTSGIRINEIIKELNSRDDFLGECKKTNDKLIICASSDLYSTCFMLEFNNSQLFLVWEKCACVNPTKVRLSEIKCKDYKILIDESHVDNIILLHKLFTKQGRGMKIFENCDHVPTLDKLYQNHNKIEKNNPK